MKRMILSSNSMYDVSGCAYNYSTECYDTVTNCIATAQTSREAAQYVLKYLSNPQVEVVIVNGDIEFDSELDYSIDEIMYEIDKLN